MSFVANLFKRNSVYVSSIFIGAFAFGLGFDKVTTAWWESHNRGKLWAYVLPTKTRTLFETAAQGHP